jgi:hypothetical protein
MDESDQSDYHGPSLSEQAERKHDMQVNEEFHDLLGEMMYSSAQRRANCTAFSHLLLSFMTAPLLTISTSL